MTDSADTEKKNKPRGGVQPKTQASKSKIAVKMRRKKIIKAILEGKTQQESGIAAGFSHKTAGSQVSKTLQNPIVQNALIHEMEKIGMNDDFLAEHLRKLIDAKKVISANIIVTGGGSDLADAGKMRKDYIQVPDYSAMARGLDLICRLRGLYKDRTEVDVKRPLTIVIRKFCSRTEPDGAGTQDVPA